MLVSAGLTDRGRVRERNEDALLLAPALGVIGVCDGIGGAAHGREASRLVVEMVVARLEHPPVAAALSALSYRVLLVAQAIHDAGRRIRAYAERHGHLGMGSTVAALVFDPQRPERGALLHAGDSLAFRLRGPHFEQLCAPHTTIGILAGAPPGARPRTLLTRAVGAASGDWIEPNWVGMQPGDVFLLCTDGLTTMLSERRIATILADAASDGPENVAQRLIDAANAAGGRDNITVVVAGIPGRD